MRVVGYAYPWNVTEPGFIDRARELGVDEIAVASLYHSARAATPWSPEHTAIHAPTAAFYRPADETAWSDLRPAEPTWIDAPDSFGDAVATLNAADIPASAWIVLTHNSQLGSARPELAVRNCFGESYPWGLCPSQLAVRTYAGEAAAASVRNVELAGAVLEACGQQGAIHQCQHEKTDGVWSPGAAQLLSICCCDACAAEWTYPPEQVRAMIAQEVRRLISGDIDATASELPDALLEDVLTTRQRATDQLREATIAALPSALRLTLHGATDPWTTGALPGLTPTAAGDVDSVVVQCWNPSDGTVDMVRAARQSLPTTTALGVYVTAAAASPVDDMAGYVGRLHDAGADELHLYHLGLAGPARWPDMEAATQAAKIPETNK